MFQYSLDYRRPCVWALLLMFALGHSAKAQEVKTVSWLPAQLQSGSPVLFTATTDAAVTALRAKWLDHDLTFNRSHDGKTWYVLAGIDVEQAPGSYPLELTTIAANDSRLHSTRPVTIKPGQYKTTTLHVEQKFVAPDAATLAIIAADKAVKDAAFARQIPEPLWRGDFRSPVPFTATDSFGTRRTFNGTLASIHRGTDFHAPSGTPVVAANDGEVIIARRMFYEGNLVVVDHGQQFSTAYMHFSRIDVQAGQHVTKGQRLGLSGATGRVTGPHLHLSARWQGMLIDPVILLKMSLPEP
jgi:murein DD-endopeptidase MepM/ murein hydrolase activator NlpD